MNRAKPTFCPKRSPILLGFLLLIPCLLSAQEIIEHVHLKEFDAGVNGYPYEVGGWDEGILYRKLDPAIRLSNGEFAYLWKPSKGFRKRIVVKYNVLLEEIWRTEFKVESEESMLHFYSHDSLIIGLSLMYDIPASSHRIMVRTFSQDSGVMEKGRFLYQEVGKAFDPPFFKISQDGKTFMVYQFVNQQKGKRIKTFDDFNHGNERLGHRVTQADSIRYAQFDISLNRIRKGSIPLDLPNNKTYILDCQHDNKGNIYISSADRSEQLTINRYTVSSGESQSLRITDFPKFWEEPDPFYTLMPPFISESGRAYLGLATRERMRGNWHTKNMELISFDFEANKVDRIRNVSTNSTLLVQVSKARQEFGLRPARKFDRYLLKEIMERPNGETLLFTQHFEVEQFRSFGAKPQDPLTTNFRLEEIIIYHFDPLGKLIRPIIIPTSQRNVESEDIEGMFYEAKLDENKGVIHLFTHEIGGERLHEPSRTYYRNLTLASGEVSDRKIVFDGRRRENHFFKSYTVWLNSSLVALTVEDGANGRTYILSVNIDGDHNPVIPKKEKKRRGSD